MPTPLEHARVAILATDGVERVEYQEPRDAVESAGATVTLLTIDQPTVALWDHDTDPAGTVHADGLVGDADPAQFDALILPGGVRNPDQLRADEDAVAFVRAVAEAGKPVAAICHGPWTLVDAGAVDGRRLTSFPSLQQDLRNAGAEWVDEEVVVDGALVTSRTPDDLPAFCDRTVEVIAAAQSGQQG